MIIFSKVLDLQKMKKISTKKILFLLLVFSVFFVFATEIHADDEREPRPLEIEDYPFVDPAPEETDHGVGEYIAYIFNAAVFLVGGLLFASLIYHGVLYMLSSGDPGKAGAAIGGVKSAFVGAVILVFSYLILQTINPELLDVDLEDLDPIQPEPLPAGPYVCNFPLPNVNSIVSGYRGGEESRAEAILSLHEKVREESLDNPEANCEIVTSTRETILEGDGLENTYFVIPSIKEEGSVLEIEHGIIFFGDKNGLENAMSRSGSRCQIQLGGPQEDEYFPDGMEVGPHKNFNLLNWRNRAYSLSPIKMYVDADVTAEVTFYEGHEYNQPVAKNADFEGDEMEEWTKQITNGEEITVLDRGDFQAEDFHCQDGSCGVRSMQVENAFVVFYDDRDCYIFTSNKKYLQETLPSSREGWFGATDRGFDRNTDFDNVLIIKGEIR